ncbi:enoyl-CoA hydratase-related protein [Nocardia miyunensis]|uniref:enoyl-CoA hydratase-related protein n=1 Tax=Nocardia miyunensis TaxID=282684 RepID=UPI0008339517|nr:enoyl-CoA hydratase-related protein [Nocardia miyunensis]
MTVQVTHNSGVRRIVIDRPDRLNAVDVETLVRLGDAVADAGTDPAVRVVVLSGAGRFFCSGADLAVSDPTSADATAQTIDAANRLVGILRSVPRPVVAELRGPAVGVGVSIALAADLVIASADAYFLLPFTSIGLMPDGGATALVAAAAGRAVAMRLFALGKRMSAHDAERFGLIAAAYSADTFAGEFDAIVATLRDGSLDAFVHTKRAVEAATLGHLDAAFAREREGQLFLAGRPDFHEALTAFAAKRPPVFNRVPSTDASGRLAQSVVSGDPAVR